MSRHAFWTQSQELLDTQHTARKSIAVMMLDLDHFKSINDNLGHLTGDSVLEQFGNTLLATTEGLGLSGRLGGEEFAVAAADCTFEEAIQLAERIRQTQETNPRSLHHFAGTDRIGAAWADRALPDMGTLLEIADTAGHRAKRIGRNGTVAVEVDRCAEDRPQLSVGPPDPAGTKEHEVDGAARAPTHSDEPGAVPCAAYTSVFTAVSLLRGAYAYLS
ncbi:GGDEF domain-containing protein [Rhodococcus erythropolis]|uniref:GGDEF domain-containing protein n=1 Tax=Rhodococcus erythropolis TaxID=1833 RepID=UPI00210E4F05|nr:GGDEF domain-containing protein [Rhodococcus erythropolis]MCQ4129219.1 GGDEF domain-containing protein [Rhodococcus erythropolis]